MTDLSTPAPPRRRTVSPGLPSPAPEAVASLTAREHAALQLVARGKSDWEIGRILDVSEHTARFHCDNARRKLAAVNRAHAVALFARAGLL